ncbi:hypothetical protein V6N13_009574 [Hibiscus sabdariffa]|uniref:FBD domain-containing protein n=1 Tax=Hibiscus sabdariffa TaxID=183260 RepID=A0ABR2NP06_9ROSI
MCKVEEGPPHKYLMELEVIGYLGQLMETNFVARLLKSAIKLQKIVIHTLALDRKMSYYDEFIETTHQTTHELAHQLMKNHPEAELVIFEVLFC